MEQEAHREYGYLTTQDGTRLAYVVWRPRTDRRYPTIVSYSTYSESGAAFARAKRFVEAGYAYVGVNVRGTGSSEGTYSYYQPIEAADGFEAVEWAAAQPWSTGDVGMVGSSYGGHTQIKVAALRPPHLKAIVPIATEGCEYHDEGMTGGVFNAALLAHWSFTVQPDKAREGVENRLRDGDEHCAAINAARPINPSYDEVRQHPFYDDWWHERSLVPLAPQVTVPTLFIHAWQDEWIRPNGVLRLFKLLGSRHKKLLLQNGPHVLSDYPFVQQQQIRWLDRWVKGERNDVEREAPITVLWEVTEHEEPSQAAPGWSTTYPSWPVPGLQWLTLYLGATGVLSSDMPSSAADCGQRRYVSPLGTELVGSHEQFAIEPHPLGALHYQTAPMTSDSVLLGSPQLTFYLSSDQPDCDFLFTLKDVGPDGDKLFLQRTVLRASLRAVDPNQSSTDELIQSFARAEPLVPGEVYEIRLSLNAVGHVIRKDHRLELSILSPGQIPNPVWGFAPAGRSCINGVYHGPSHPSQLRLPIVAGEQAQAPMPRAGVLRNQPVRSAKAR